MYELGTQQSRYQEFLTQAPEMLEGEAALLRLLIESAAKENRPSMVNSLISTLSKVASVSQAAKLRAGELVEREMMLKISLAVAGLFAAVLKKREIPEWEEIVCEVARDVESKIGEIGHEPSGENDGQG